MFRREPRATSSLESEAIEQIMERLPHGVRRLAAQLRTPLGIEELWAVLTDYENLSTFIPQPEFQPASASGRPHGSVAASGKPTIVGTSILGAGAILSLIHI